MPSPIEEMIEALAIEIEAVKKASRSSVFELRGGTREGKAGTDTLYLFPLTEEPNVRDDSPIKLRVGGKEVDGTIVSIANGVLTIALTQDLGREIAFARLVINDSFLIERLRDKLVEINNGKTAFQHSSADALLTNAGAIDEVGVPSEVLHKLNAPQKTAVRRSAGSSLAFIWGPPGTGKTLTLAAVVHAIYLQGKSILLVSNTNIAVDTALERIGDKLKSLPEFHSAAVLRFGPIVSETLRAKYHDQVNLDSVIKRHSAALVKEQRKITTKAARVQDQLQNVEQNLTTYKALNDASKRVRSISQQYEQVKAQDATSKQIQEQLRKTLAQSQADLARAQVMGSMRRFFAGLNPEKLQKTVATCQVQLKSEQDASASRKRLMQECVSHQKRARKERELCKKRLQSVAPEADCKRHAKLLNKRLDKYAAQIQAIQSALASIRQELVSKCRVLATTIYQAYLKPELAREFDVVIVDEASMLALPMVFYAAGKAKERVIVAGDFRQLPPIVLSDDDRCEKWLKTDVFHHAGIAREVNAGRTPHSMVALCEQFRMQQDICDLLNRHFYAGQLTTAGRVKSRQLRRPFPSERGLLYVDTSSWQPWAACRLGSFSRYNILHALLIRNIVKRLEHDGYLCENDRLGVVSPFSAQCRLIAQLIGEALNKRGTLYAATVHRFQGNERDAMICDITDSIGCRVSKFAKASNIEEDGARLLNVALSRAKLCTVLVANFEFLEAKLPRDSYVRRILNDFRHHGSPLDVSDCFPIDPAAILAAQRAASGNKVNVDLNDDGVTAFTESNFFQAFQADCLRARQEIVIFSPFMTERGTSRWVDLLRAKIKQGVRVRLVTRPPGDQGGVLEHGLPELIESIRAIGIVVDERTRMHEKLAFIDRRFVWNGSLNILSHRDTTESMLRIGSPAAYEQIGRFVASSTAKRDECDLSTPENPKCECGKRMVWNNGRFGVWFQCECGHKADASGKLKSRSKPNSKKSPEKKPAESVTGKCPDCGKALKEKNGRFGPFIGCSNFPKCRYTAKHR